MERRLREEAVGGRDAKDAAHDCRDAQEHDVPRVPARLLGAVPLGRTDDATDLVVKVEEDGDDDAGDDGDEYPADGELPKFDEKVLAARGRRSERL